MTPFDVIWFGANDDFTANHLELEQRPLATVQTALTAGSMIAAVLIWWLN